MSVGDTIPINNPWAAGEVETEVIAIDSVLIQGLYRRRINVDWIFGWSPEYWIEGIGSTNGLFYTGHYVFDQSFQLMCFHENDTLIYLNSPNGDCYYILVGIEEMESVSEIVIFPNPATNEFTLEIDKPNSGKYSLVIYNSNGQLIERLDNIQSTMKYDLSVYESGVYFLRLEMNNTKLMTKRLIIK